MNFDLTEEQLAIKQMVRDFAEREVAPVAEELDEKEVHLNWESHCGRRVKNAGNEPT